MFMRKRLRGQGAYNSNESLIFSFFPRHLLLPFLALSACFILAAFNIQAGFRISMTVEDAIKARALSNPPQSGPSNKATDDNPSSENSSADLPSEERLARRDWSLRIDTRRDEDILTLDIGVPLMGDDEKLLNFFAPSFAQAVHEFNAQVNLRRGHVQFRLLVSRYPSDDSSVEFQQALAEAASLNNAKDVVFVPTEATTFHRSHAINLLHRNTQRGNHSVLAVVDVDMWIGPRFFFNALNEVDHETVYFPIVFSEYRPSTVLLMEKLLGPQPNYSKHRGLWRKYGHGMYSMTGDNARSFLMDENFTKWGGEDGNFFDRAEERWKIARHREYDLVHKWHPKYCDSSFVEESFWSKCRDSRRKVEGSSLAVWLLELKAEEPDDFEELFLSSRNVAGHSELADVIELASKEYKPGKGPEDEVSVDDEQEEE